MSATEVQPTSRPRKRRWFQFSVRTLLLFVFLVSVGMSWFAVKVTFPWEATWVKRATSLTLHEPEETLSGADLKDFLEGFGCDKSRQLGLRCTLGMRRTGYIRVDGKTYPVELFRDKFLGDVVLVRRRWKTVEVFRSWRYIPTTNSVNNARPLSRGIHAADASGVAPTAAGW